MKKTVTGAVIVCAVITLTGCAAGQVTDKRAPGYPGEKTYQIEIENSRPIGPDRLWITVSREVWWSCRIQVDEYPDCAG